MKNENFANLIGFGLYTLGGVLFAVGGICLNLFTNLSSFVPITFYITSGSFFVEGIKSVVKYFKNKHQKKSKSKEIREDYEVKEATLDNEKSNEVVYRNNLSSQKQLKKSILPTNAKDDKENDVEMIK